MCHSLGFPGGSAGKESACNVGDLGSIPGMGRSPGEGKGYPFQYFGLENSMDCIVHGVAKSLIRLSNFHFQAISLATAKLEQPVTNLGNYLYKLCSMLYLSNFGSNHIFFLIGNP